MSTIGDNQSLGYGGDTGQSELELSKMGVLAGSGEILSTGEDMAKFLRIMCGLDPYPVEGAVDRALVLRGEGEGMLGMGYGWDIDEGPQTVWTKSGLTAGFTSYFAIQRTPQVGVAILSNRVRHAQIVDAVKTLLNAVADTL